MPPLSTMDSVVSCFLQTPIRLNFDEAAAAPLPALDADWDRQAVRRKIMLCNTIRFLKSGTRRKKARKINTDLEQSK